MSPERRAVGGLAPRKLALGILLDYSRRDAFLNALMAYALSSTGLERRDRAFVSELVRGTVERLLSLDYALSGFSSRSLESLHPPVLWTLRMGAFQLMYMDVPAYAAIDTSVELLKRAAGAGAASFCNGVLRALERGKNGIEWPTRDEDPLRYMEVVHSHPAWVVRMWIEELGGEKAESLCRADNLSRPLSVRVNLQKTDRALVTESLRAGSIEVEESRLAFEGLLLKGAGGVATLAEYDEGLISIQDQGSMVVGRAVGARPGMSVLDMCAAPGGKANHLCELMGNDGRVLAVDINENRLGLALEAARRLGNSSLDTMVADATKITSLVDDRFDRVIIDAPCTGLGVLGRRPDARWRRGPDDVRRLAELQSELIDEGAGMLKPDGILVYSTCTISRTENEGNVERFLESNREFEPSSLDGFPGWDGRYLKLFGDTHGCDGMFACALKRRV